MKRYAIINEPCVEISLKDYNAYQSIIDAHCANGMMNGEFTIIATADTLEEARRKLAQYKCSYGLTTGFSGTKFYTANLTYFAEQEYDEEYEEWNDTGDYEYAEYAECDN